MEPGCMDIIMFDMVDTDFIYWKYIDRLLIYSGISQGKRKYFVWSDIYTLFHSYVMYKRLYFLWKYGVFVLIPANKKFQRPPCLLYINGIPYEKICERFEYLPFSQGNLYPQ